MIGQFYVAFIISSVMLAVAALLMCTKQVFIAGQHALEQLSNTSIWKDACLRMPFVKLLQEEDSQSKHRMQCLRDIPQMLDVLTLGLSSGLSFDGSLDLYCKRSHTALSQELAQAMTRWRLGLIAREQALEELGQTLHIEALNRFAHVVGESLTFGAPLTETLEHQAEVLRAEQRSQVEEDIEKLPVKMLIPLGSLILPAMLIAILGPLLGSTFSFV